MSVFAFLFEPASYTVDRNEACYKPLGIKYCYLHGKSEAKSELQEDGIDFIENLGIIERVSYFKKVLSTHKTIIFNGYSGCDFFLLFLLNLFYKRSIGLDSDTQYRKPRNRIKRFIKSIWLGIVFQNKHYFGLAGGNYTHKDLFIKYGMPSSRVMLMPMMVDNNKFLDNSIKEIKPFRFIYVGRLVDCKNIDLACEAFIKFHENNPDSELHIVGKGYLEAFLKKKYGMCKAIVFAGTLFGKDLVKYYHECNVLILPSTYEPWGLVVNEAMCGGLPVLASREVGAIHDLIVNNNTGFVFNPYDVTDLIKCMEKILDKHTYEVYSKNAYNLVHNYWNYDLYKKCLIDFINTADNNDKKNLKK